MPPLQRGSDVLRCGGVGAVFLFYIIPNWQLVMTKVTKEQYEFALARIEALLLLANEEEMDERAGELASVSDMVIEYEKEHWVI